MDFRNLLYPILDFDFCYAQNVPLHSLISVWELYPKVISFFQLRAKSLSPSDYKNLFLSTQKKSNLPIIINDHLDIALECNAFGIHIGKEDYQNLHTNLKRELKKIPNVVPASISLFSNIELFAEIVSICHKNIA